MKSVKSFLVPMCFAVATLTAIAGCSSSSTGPATDEGAIIQNSPCEVIRVNDDHKMTAKDLDDLADPVATNLLKRPTCATTYREMQGMLKEGPCSNGIQTRIVSERSQLFDTPDIGRAV